jgi:hypothetical protein
MSVGAVKEALFSNPCLSSRVDRPFRREPRRLPSSPTRKRRLSQCLRWADGASLDPNHKPEFFNSSHSHKESSPLGVAVFLWTSVKGFSRSIVETRVTVNWFFINRFRCTNGPLRGFCCSFLNQSELGSRSVPVALLYVRRTGYSRAGVMLARGHTCVPSVPCAQLRRINNQATLIRGGHSFGESTRRLPRATKKGEVLVPVLRTHQDQKMGHTVSARTTRKHLWCLSHERKLELVSIRR